MLSGSTALPITPAHVAWCIEGALLDAAIQVSAISAGAGSGNPPYSGLRRPRLRPACGSPRAAHAGRAHPTWPMRVCAHAASM